MGELFRLGGWGMYPTTLFGLVAVALAGWYAARRSPDSWRRYRHFFWITLLAGLLGFVTGAIRSCLYIGDVEPEKHFLVIIGLGESAVNLAAALFWMLFGEVVAAAGRWRQPDASTGGQRA